MNINIMKLKSSFYSLFLIGLTSLLPVMASAKIFDVMVFDPSNFSPTELTIQVGDTVRWTNASGGRSHDVTADDFSWNSITAPSFTFSRVFNTPGDIPYHCTVHSRPASLGGTVQNGTIHVQATQATTDVSVESVDADDGIHKAGGNFSTLAVLKNNTAVDSGMFNISFYASTDMTITISDTLLSTQSISNIAGNTSMNVNASPTLPANLPVGDYFIGSIIDLADSNSANNTNVDASSIFVFRDFIINAGLNDAWFNPATDGQGFFLTVFPNLAAVTLAWFTYDTQPPASGVTANLGDPGHRWLTALGPIDGDMSVMNVTITSGGLFDDPTAVSRVQDGSITLKFSNCKKGTATYNIPSINAQGVVPIQRVAIDNVTLCEALLREATLNP